MKYSTHMLSDPKSHHPFQQAGFGFRRTGKQIDVRLGDWGRRLTITLQCVLAFGVFDEVDLLAQVANGRNEKIKSTVLGVELAVGGVFRKSNFANEGANETNHSTGDVAVLSQPMRQSTSRQSAAASMREESLLCGLLHHVGPLVDEMAD